MPENGPFGTPFSTPKIPPKRFMWVLFLLCFPGNEAHKLFSGGPNWGVGVGAKKFMLKPPRTFQARNKEPKPKLFGPDIFGWSGVLPREGVGAKKFGLSFEVQGNQIFWRDILGFFCREIPGRPKSLRNKKFVFDSCPKKVAQSETLKCCWAPVAF